MEMFITKLRPIVGTSKKLSCKNFQAVQLLKFYYLYNVLKNVLEFKLSFVYF